MKTTFYNQELYGNIANKIETSIITSVIMSPEQHATSFLSKIPKYWFTEEYYPYYEAIQKAHENKKLDTTYIYSLLINEYRQQEEKVMLILANTHIIVTIDDYIPLLEQKYLLRQQAKLSKKLQYATDEYKVLNIEQEIQDHKLLYREQYSIKTFAEWDKFYKENHINIQKYELGIPFLDETLDKGIELGQLVLISGEFEAGKTSLVLQILENLSKHHKTCLFSFEFPIHTHILKRHKFFKKMIETSRLTQENVENIKNNMVIIDEGTEISEIENRIVSLFISGIKFFAIDSQMCIFNENFEGLGEKEESSKFEILQRLAKKHNIVIILIVQTSKLDNTSPMGSKKGAYFSSIIIRIENVIDEKTKEINHSRKRIVFQKNKQTGKNDIHNVYFDKETRLFYSNDIPNKKYIIQPTQTETITQQEFDQLIKNTKRVEIPFNF